jgi:hypothetical protein
MYNNRGTTVKTLAGATALALGLGLATTGSAAVIIPDKGGFSGYFNLGVGGVDVESNMLASIMNGNIDIGKKTVDNLSDSPKGSENAAIPTFNFELSYTFESTRTQVHIGNLLEDFLRFDSSTIAGVRQDVGNFGLVGASVETTSVDTQVWSDPYLTGAKRKDTDRTGKGFRVYWQQIGKSGLELRYTAKEIDIDKERSGESLALSPAQRKLLDRNGDTERFDMFYEFSSDDKRHIVTPALSYSDRDLDGEAMANDGGAASVNYIYQYDKRWRYVFNASYSDMEMKKANPIYGVKDKYNSYGASVTMFYTEPFGWKDWAFNTTVGYFEEDHDLDFYDSSAGVVTMGMLLKF